MFEGDFEDMCGKKIPLVSIGGSGIFLFSQSNFLMSSAFRRTLDNFMVGVLEKLENQNVADH